jgi:hypothetical protein
MSTAGKRHTPWRSIPRSDGGERLLHHVLEPRRAAVAEAARLADDHRAAVALPHVAEHVAQRADARVARRHRDVRARSRYSIWPNE